MTTRELVNAAKTALENRKDRSAWDRGITNFAYDLLDTVIESNATPAELTRSADIINILLNGARDWTEFSYGGCWLIYDGDIAESLCTPSELKKTRNGERNPNSRETWLDVQARALYQAGNRAARAIIRAANP